MRVLMVVRQFFPWVGGTERQAQKLATKLIELGIEVRVITGWWSWKTPRQESIGSVPVFRNFTCWNMFNIKGLRKFGGYLYMLSLLGYLWTHRREYDLIHVHLLSYPAFPAVLAGEWLAKKTVIKIANSSHDSDLRRMRANDMLFGQRQMLPVILTADQIVAINRGTIDELREAGVPLERISLIPNGVETDRLQVKHNYELSGTLTIIFVGRLHPQKELHVLLAAFKQARDKRPGINWRLWILGDGPLHDQLEKMTHELGIAEVVKFWGQVDDVATYLAQADVFVLTSRAEGMSNALLEAMAHGLPCVASDIDGNTDLIQHNDSGLLVNPGSETGLAEALIHLADDEELRQKLGSSAARRTKNEFSLDSVARRYLALYHNLLRT